MIDMATLANVIGVAAVSSVSHCAFMCGGFVMAFNAKLSKMSAAGAVFYNLIYHFGRIFGYAVLGVLFGILGAAVVFSAKSKGVLLFFVGVFLVFLGVSLLKRGKMLEILENEKIAKILAPKFRYFSQKNGALSFFALGLINGFLPCGVVYYFLALSFGSANIFDAAMIMAIFGLSTLPAMMIFGGVVHKLNAKFRSKANALTAIFIVGYGVYLAYIGFMVTR